MKLTKANILTMLYMVLELSLSNKDDYRYYQYMKRQTKGRLMLEYLTQCDKLNKYTSLYNLVLEEYNKYYKVVN